MKFVFNVFGWLQNFNIFFMYWRKFFCRYAGCQRLAYTSGFKKHLYAPIGALLTKYSFNEVFILQPSENIENKFHWVCVVKLSEINVS